MRFLASFILTIALLVSQAQAENLLKQLGKGLNRLGQNVERSIQRIDKNIKKSLRPKTMSETTTRTCVVYNQRGLILDEETCRMTTSCRSTDQCNLEFMWPSGNKTIIELQSGRAARINGSIGNLQKFSEKDCVTNTGTNNRFCWMDPNGGSAPRNPQSFATDSQVTTIAPIDRASLVRKKANQLIAKVRALPPNLDSLRKNRWFRFNQLDVSDFAAAEQRQIASLYTDGIIHHTRNALDNAKQEIAEMFRDANPLTQSATDAIKLCREFGSPPDEIAKLCEEQTSLLVAKIERARCRRAITDSGANSRMLITSAKVSGSGYKSWPIRKVICAGIDNRPHYKITIGNGSIPFVTSPSLQVYEGEIELLDVTFKITTSRDDRSFTKMLVDIATGENEKEVPETLVGNNIRFKAPHIKWSNPESIIGCVLGFRKCD